MENLNEAASFRMVAGPNEFYDILNGIKPGQWFTFGYVSAVDVDDIPKKKVLNPKTNRMIGVPDYDAYSQSKGLNETICGIIKLMTYNMQYQSQDKVSTKYRDFKNYRDELRSKYGQETQRARYQTDTMNVGQGINAYNGQNDELQGNTYTNLIMTDIRPLSTTYYFVLNSGKLQEVNREELSIAKKADSMAGMIEKLKAAGASDEEIEPLKNFNYRRFEHSHVLFLSATSDGVPTIFINTKLSDKIKGITGANPQELIDIAQSKYSKYINIQEEKNMEKKTTLTEAQLRQAISNAVARILSESSFDDAGNFDENSHNDELIDNCIQELKEINSSVKVLNDLATQATDEKLKQTLRFATDELVKCLQGIYKAF